VGYQKMPGSKFVEKDAEKCPRKKLLEKSKEKVQNPKKSNFA
jgi:hypothetical protein